MSNESVWSRRLAAAVRREPSLGQTGTSATTDFAEAIRPRPRPPAAATVAPSACSCFIAPAATLPAKIASANRVMISSIERMLSSLPGMGRSISSGSQSVSIRRHGGDAQLLGLADRVFLLPRIDDHQALGQPVHRPHAVEVAVHLPVLAVQRRLHLLRVGRHSFFRTSQGLELFEAREPAADRAEVGQRAAQPAVADKRHAAAEPLLFDHVAGLPLRADQQHQAALRGDLLQVLSRRNRPRIVSRTSIMWIRLRRA